MSNLDQYNNESGQPRNTDRQSRFLASAFSLGCQVYGFITTPLQIPSDGPVRPSADKDSPSTPILPGSYPSERHSSIEPTTLGSVPLEEPDLGPSAQYIPEQATASQAREELGLHVFEAPAASGGQLEEPAIPASVVGASEQAIASTPKTRDECGEHVAFRYQSEGPATSHNERSNTPVFRPLPEPTTASQFQGAYGVSISGNPNFTNIGHMTQTHVNHYGGFHGLEHMEKFVSFNAFHNSAVQDPDRVCHPGTRLVVLNRIRNWFDNTTSRERAFWLHGPAGAGKSAIAQTVARSSTQGQVVATFFFYRSDPSRNDGNRLFPTIAWQLAFSIPGIKDHIIDALKRRPDLPRMDIETQFEEFIFRPFQALKDVLTYLPSPVVIIDGVDECLDEKHQRRFLKLIGNAIKDNHIPLRFLIYSRPEAHIQETIDLFPKPNLVIDLASLDDANHDIEKYLKDEFSRIASDQGLDSTTWPGNTRIQQVVYKSSGQFIYASTVIRYVSDEYNSAVTQLDIILGLKPPPSKSPFAELDALFIGILERQPDLAFLMTFLALLLARLSINGGKVELRPRLYSFDDPLLMNVSKLELHRKLRGMRSLFKFEPYIDLHHRSFLDFLQDSSRSHQFYISRENSHGRYLELITDSVVRFVSKTVDQPNHHGTGHFCPQFRYITRDHRTLRLPVTMWQKALKPLICLQDKLLTLPNFTSTWNLLPCDTCVVFQIMRDLLLHLIIIQGTCRPVTSSIQTVEQCLNESDLNKSIDAVQNGYGNEDNLVVCLYSLLTQLRKVELGSSVNTSRINLMCSLLRFDHPEIANRLGSVEDAQILMDFIDFLTNDDHFLNQCGLDTPSNLLRLALEIYARVPVLPRCLFSSKDYPGHGWSGPENKMFNIRCQTALLRRISDHNYVVPLSRIYDQDGRIWFVDNVANESKSLKEWRTTSNPNSVEMIRAMLEVAKAIRYLHSIGALFTCEMELDDIFLYSNFNAKIRFLCTTLRYMTETPKKYLAYQSEKKWDSYETNIFIFGCFFYEMYFDRRIPEQSRWDCKTSEVSERPSEPEIQEDAWQLIQRCCARDPRTRPSMDQVVQEMGSWDLS